MCLPCIISKKAIVRYTLPKKEKEALGYMKQRSGYLWREVKADPRITAEHWVQRETRPYWSSQKDPETIPF